MGWIGRGGGEGGPRCIVLAASGQTFHRPSQLSLPLSLSFVLSFLLSFLFPSSALTDLSVPFPLPFRPSLRRSFFLFFPETPDNYCRLLVCNSLDAQFYYRFPPTCTLPTLPPSCSRNLRSWSRLSISYLG